MKLSALIRQLNNSLVALGDVEVKIKTTIDGKELLDREISGVSCDGDKVYILNERSSGLGGF